MSPIAAGRWAEIRGNWRLLLGAALGMAAGVTGVVPYVSGLFLPHLMVDFGWSRSAVSFGQTLQAAGGAVVVPLTGLLVDRVGSRLPIIAGLGGFAACLASLALLDGNLHLFWATMFAVGCFGALAGPLVFTRIVARRFDSARGLAIGLTLSGVGIGAALYPMAIGAVVGAFGWRAAYCTLAVIVAAILVPVLALTASAPERSVTSAQVTPVRETEMLPPSPPLLLLRLIVAFFLASLAVTGFLLHMMPMVRAWGMTPTAAGLVQSALGLSMLVSRLCCGAIVDRVSATRVAAACMALGATGAVLLTTASPVLALPAAILLGTALGSEVDLIGFLVARNFPLARYGRIYGLIYGAALIGAGTSPALMALLIDSARGYPAVLAGSALSFAASSLLFLTLPPSSRARRRPSAIPRSPLPDVSPSS